MWADPGEPLTSLCIQAEHSAEWVGSGSPLMTGHSCAGDRDMVMGEDSGDAARGRGSKMALDVPASSPSVYAHLE